MVCRPLAIARRCLGAPSPCPTGALVCLVCSLPRAGADNGGDGIADHSLWLGCRHFVEADDDLVPTGRVVPAEGPMDFSAPGGVVMGPR